MNDDLNSFAQLPSFWAGRPASVSREIYTSLCVKRPIASTPWPKATGSWSPGNPGVGGGRSGAINMVDVEGDPIYAMPKYLLVPPQLKFLAQQIYTSRLVNDFTIGVARPTDNPFRDRFEAVSSPFLSASGIAGSSASTFYLLADPSILPVISDN